MNFHNKSEDERKREQLKKDIKQLKRKNEAISSRKQKLRHDINSDNVGPASSYALPLAATDGHLNATQATVADVQHLLAANQTKLKLQCHAMSTGITAWQSEDVITFTFDPCILGTFYGPYKVRMKAAKDKQTNKGRIYLRGHDLPPAVPVTDLYKDHFEQEEDKYSSTNLNPFLDSVMKFLRSFLSRQAQFQELKDQFKDDVREFKSVSHCTAVQFKLDLKDEGQHEAITASIALNYEKDGERPKPESLRVTLMGQQLSQEDRDAFNEQCVVFYTHRLAEAVVAAF